MCLVFLNFNRHLPCVFLCASLSIKVDYYWLASHNIDTNVVIIDGEAGPCPISDHQSQVQVWVMVDGHQKQLSRMEAGGVWYGTNTICTITCYAHEACRVTSGGTLSSSGDTNAQYLQLIKNRHIV